MTELTVNSIEVTNDQLALIKKTIATGATDDELKLFLYDCQRQGIHPLDKLIHFTKRGGKYVPITSIDLFRTRATSTGEYLGCTKAQWTGKAGEPGSKVEMCARRAVGVHVAEHWAEAYWDEYVPPQGQRMFWDRMPHVMLSKVCEALCIRKGFPKELSGLYISEEMDQAKEQTYGEALTQDFPPDTWLKGVLVKFLPVAGTMPTQLFIQTDDGTMQFSTFLQWDFRDWQDEPIEFQYGKQGKLRVVTELRLPKSDGHIKESVVAPAPLPLQAPHKEYEQPVTVSSEDIDLYAATVEADTDTDDGEPEAENFFAPDHDVAGTLVSFAEGEVTVKKTGEKKYKCDLVFSCADGQIEVTAWDRPLAKWQVSWEELLDQKVWFRAAEGREYRGKMQYTLMDISHYN